MVEFDMDCDGAGGIIIVEKNKLRLLSKELAALLNIVTDVNGETSLKLDYPHKPWSNVWRDATNRLQTFCNKGVMFVGLLKDGQYSVEVNPPLKSKTSNPHGLLKVKGKSLLFVETSELIQKILYPQLSLNILAAVKINPGYYKVAYSTDNITQGNLVINLSTASREVFKSINNVTLINA